MLIILSSLLDPVERAPEHKTHAEQLPTLSNILGKPESPLPHGPAAEKPLLNGSDSNGIHATRDTDTNVPTPAPVDVAPVDAAPVPADATPTPLSPRASPKALTPKEASPTPAPKEEAVSSETVPAAVEEPRARTPVPVKEPEEQSMQSPQDVSLVEEPKDAHEGKDIEMSDAPEKSVEESTEEPTLPTSEVDLQPTSLSQLAIESEREPLSTEVSMTEAAAPKVAREREEDTAEEEPAMKRAKTEPEEEPAPAEEVIVAESQPAAAASVDPDAPVLDGTTLTKLPQWENTEKTGATLTPFQRREIRKVLTRMKKTKAGSNFRDSVQKLWPALWDTYMTKVDQPMDLAELERKVRESIYSTLGDFQADLALIYKNALLFNGPIHDITTAGLATVKQAWEDVLPIPAEEPARPKPAPKAKPMRESRIAAEAAASASRRQSGVAAPNSTSDGSAAKGAAAKDQADRRSSTATEGERPKRTVRAPKPKDIDYTTKPSRKKLKPEMQFAEEVLTEVMSPKHQNLNAWFMDPVDAEGLNIPDYYSVIKKPMHLNKVAQMLNAGEFASLKDFEKTTRLIFDNCFTFNGPVDQLNPVSKIAKQLEDLFNDQMKGKDAWLARYAKANAPAFNDSDDEEDEDEDDYGDDGGDAADSKEIAELQAKLDEETKKLNSMFISGNQSMIDIQKSLVDMVQKALIKAAQAAQSKPKGDKPKKAGRGGKAKGAGGRKSTGGGTGKKAGGPKKAGVKKSLTAAEKDQIANAINDLEYPHLDKAIDIIKRDTGQNVSHTHYTQGVYNGVMLTALGKHGWRAGAGYRPVEHRRIAQAVGTLQEGAA